MDVSDIFQGQKFYLIALCLLGSMALCAQSQRPPEPIFLSPGSSFYKLEGFVTMNGTTLDSCKVYLFREQSQGNVELVDSVYSLDLNGEYKFERIIEGAYYLQACDLNQRAVPTYYGGSPFWKEARGILLQADTKSRNIELQELKVSNAGSGIVSGKIVYGEGFIGHIEGEGAKNVPFILRNSVGKVIQHVLSNVDGEFALTNLPLNSGELIIDFPGKSMVPIKVSLSTSNTEVGDLQFRLEKKEVVHINALGMDIKEEKNSWVVGPNPFNDIIIISNSNADAQSKVKLMDLSGNVLLNAPLTEDDTRVDLMDLNRGIYLLTIENRSGIVLTKKMVRK